MSRRDGRADPLLHQLRDVDPERVVLHLQRRVELERLVVEVEVQPGECLGVAVEEPGRPAADDAVERGDPLLAVEQELDDAGGERPVAAGVGVLGPGRPDQQAADRVLAVEREHEAADLVAVPDVAALELGQGHAAQVDLAQDGVDLHALPPTVARWRIRFNIRTRSAWAFPAPRPRPGRRRAVPGPRGSPARGASIPRTSARPGPARSPAARSGPGPHRPGPGPAARRRSRRTSPGTGRRSCRT